MLYLGTSDLPIYRFDKIQQTSNLAYLVMEWDERKDIKVPEAAQTLWETVLDVWHEKTANNESKNYYALYNEVDYLEKRYTMLSTLIYGLSDANKEDYGREINAWGFKFNIKGKIKPQIKDLERQLRAAKTKIGIKQNELKTLSEGGKKGMSLLKQKIKLERVLEVKINLKETPVDEWLELFNEAEELTAEKKRSHGK